MNPIREREMLSPVVLPMACHEFHDTFQFPIFKDPLLLYGVVVCLFISWYQQALTLFLLPLDSDTVDAFQRFLIKKLIQNLLHINHE